MKKAIAFLRSKGLNVSDNGIVENLPDGEIGLRLIDELENATMTKTYCYTLIDNHAQKIEI